jgi:hypothetical protein
VCYVLPVVRSKRVFLALVFVAIGGLFAPACLSPTLPLPPPSRPVIEGPDERGNVTLSGNVMPEAEVYAHNTETDRIDGQLTGPDGAYSIVVAAEVGDEITFWYTIGARKSPDILFRVPEPQ